MSSMITATAWVPRGHAAQFPRRYEFDEDEYERISSMTAQALEDAKEDARDAGAPEEEIEGATASKSKGEKHKKKKKKDKKNKKAADDDDDSMDDNDDDLKEFDLDHYDDEGGEGDENTERGGDAMGMFGSVKNLAYHSSNREDPYITLPAGDADDEEEREELQILASDNMVLAARVEDEVSHLEVYVYEDGEDNLYVHHDVMLPAIPLAIEWLSVPVGDQSQTTDGRNGAESNGSSKDVSDAQHGNYVAVGTLDPDIEVWDLDTVDCMYPAAILGSGHASSTYSALGTGKKKKRSKKPNAQYHTDAVLALAANSSHRNLLASGSADRTVKLWDLNTAGSTGKAAQSYDALHSDKVCSLAWHATESTALLSGGYDKTAVASDMRAPDAGVRRWRVDSDVESVRWDPHDANFFYVACESGMLYYFDARNAPSKEAKSGVSDSVWRLQAHDGPVSSFDANPIVPGFLATGSGDKTVKLWNVPAAGGGAKGPSMVVSRDLDVGKVFSTSFAPDREVGFRLAVAGSAGKLQIWDTSTNKAVRTAFAGRVGKSAEEEVNERLVGLTVDEESSSDSGDEEDDEEDVDEDGGWEDGVEEHEEDDEDNNDQDEDDQDSKMDE